jgi:membrane protein DedA with SNARE-associated domain
LEKILAFVAGLISNVIAWLGYPGVIALMAIESACIPLPSEVIMPFSGYLVSTGRFNLHWASLAGALGCVVGSALAYAVGAWGGRPLIEKYGKYVLIRHRDVEQADAWFARYGGWAIFFSRLLPVVRTFISLPAGIARMPIVRFLLLSFIGSVPWCYMLTYVGFLLGEHWHDIRKYFRGADIVIVILGVLLFAFWIYRHLKTENGKEG